MKQKEFTDIEEKILDVADYWIEKIKTIFSRMDKKEEKRRGK
jgi:predicted transcriptional regulator